MSIDRNRRRAVRNATTHNRRSAVAPARRPAPTTRSCAVLLPMAHGGGADGNWITSYQNIVVSHAMRGQNVRLLWSHGLSQVHARALLLWRFLNETDCADALLTDADVAVVSPSWVDYMLTASEPLLCGVYRSRSTCAVPWVYDLPPGGSATEIGEGGVRMLPLLHAGLGFVRIRRDALLAMVEDARKHEPDLFFAEPQLGDARVADLCRPMTYYRADAPDVPRRADDDWSFFQRARRAGLTLKCLVDMPLVHNHQTGNFAEDQGRILGAAPVGDGSNSAETIATEYALDDLPDACLRVLDLGANRGDFAREAFRRWPACNVMSYEPHPSTFAQLDQSMGETTRWSGACVAVTSPEKARAKARLYAGVNGDHECSLRDDVRWSLPSPHVSQDLQRWTMVDTLDASTLPPCDVLKVDTEGSEVEILTHYKHLDAVKVLLVEVHPAGCSEEEQARKVAGLALSAGLGLLDTRGCVMRFLRPLRAPMRATDAPALH